MPTTIRERTALSRLRQIINDPSLKLLRANHVQRKIRCGGVGCRCRRSKRNEHPVNYISQSQKGKFRTKFVPADQVTTVCEWIALYQEARDLLMKIGDFSWDRVGS